MINCINQHNVVKVADQPCELLQFTSDESDNEENDEIGDSKCNTKCDRSLKPICLNKQRYANYYNTLNYRLDFLTKETF